jgi:phosphoserine phosphatase RsbU/P
MKPPAATASGSLAAFPSASKVMSKPSWLLCLLRAQAVYVGVALIIAGFFWGIGQASNFVSVLAYAFCLGNFISFPANWVRRMYGHRPFPYNWLIFLAAVILLTPLVYFVSSVIVWWIAPPSPQTLRHLITTGWKLPSLVIVVFALISALFAETKERLEQRNIELQRTVERSAAQLEVQERELERAREIQQSLLPKEIPQLAGFEVATAWRPARVVGGDYFDVLRLGDDRLGICVADVVGKGLSAALLMANVQAAVRLFARDSGSPASVCSRLNAVLCENIAIGKFVTFFYGVLDARKRMLQYCNAGHPLPILVSANNSLKQLPAGGAVLGVFPAWNYQDSVIGLNPGDRLLLFTDGIIEAAGSDGQEFGENQLAALAKTNRTRPASELNNLVLARVTDFCSGQLQDDATLLVVAVK